MLNRRTSCHPMSQEERTHECHTSCMIPYVGMQLCVAQSTPIKADYPEEWAPANANAANTCCVAERRLGSLGSNLMMRDSNKWRESIRIHLQVEGLACNDSWFGSTLRQLSGSSLTPD